MDLRLLLCQIAIKHGTEDGASHGQNVLCGERGEDGITFHFRDRNINVNRAFPFEGLLNVHRHFSAFEPEGKTVLTLCAGTFCDSPMGPTIKWTSAISSLLNIKAFLGAEKVFRNGTPRVQVLYKSQSVRPPTLSSVCLETPVIFIGLGRIKTKLQ